MSECTKCGFSNPEHARFCSGCGVAVALIGCPDCAAQNEPGARFCNACGHSLAEKLSRPALRSSHAERRILTVLFCDLVDSTRLVDELDPEVCRAIIREFQTTCTEIIEEHGGRVSTYLGDGIVALFSRLESNAERAINASLMIHKRIAQAQGSFSLCQREIQVRCGISTGLAVVGDDLLGDTGIHQDTAVGLPMNMAARIQGLAQAGGIAVGGETYQMTRTQFEFEDLGQHALKGIKDSQRVWRVIARKDISSQLIERAAQVTPMVDRTGIVRTLLDGWNSSLNEGGSVAILSGEPGVGKSRILQQLATKLGDKDRYYALDYQCAAYHSNTALYPIISHLKTTAGFERGEPAAQRLGKLEQLIGLWSDRFEQDMSAFVELLSLPAEHKWPAQQLDPDKRKEQILSAFLRYVSAMATERPVLITFEDAHWMDPTTLELLSRLVRDIEQQSIFLLITSRPGFAPDFINLEHVQMYEVESLPKKYAKQLVDQIQGGKSLPRKILKKILQRTEGNPLFIEEISKSMLEMLPVGDVINDELSDTIVLPATVQESLLARLDRLPEASRAIAHLAAVIGRIFSYDLLERVADYQSKNLYKELMPLLNAQLVFQSVELPDAEYSFKHALVRDVAYETLLKSDLSAIHFRIASVLEEHYPDILLNSPELIARHFTEGNDAEKAVEYWLKAGKKASRQFALIEARAHLTAGLKCLDQCEDTDQSKHRRLALLIVQGPVLMALEGSGSEITRQNYAQAVALCDELPVSAMQFKALWGQWNVSMDYNRDQGLAWADKLQGLAETLDSPDLRLQAHHCQWTTRFHYANHRDAQAHLDKGIALYDDKRHRHHAAEYGGHDPKVCGLSFLAFVRWFLGDIDAADEAAQQSLAHAQKLDHAGSRLHVIELSLLLSQYQRKPAMIRDLTEQLQEICDTIGLPEYEGKLNCCRGIVMANADDLSEGIELIKQGLDQLNAVGTTEDVPLYTEYLAQALGQAQKTDEALKYVDELLDSLEAQKLRYWQAELFRRKGLLLQDKGEMEQAKQYLLQSLQTANQQSALALALRAGLSLYQFNLQTDLFPEARETLEGIYGAFAEGQSSTELDEARAILR